MAVKTKNREQMMAWLSKHLKFVRTTEEFNGSVGGIWTSGENGETYGGYEIFDYWAENYKLYDIGVLIKFQDMVNKYGWYCEWHDAGTMMLWEDK